MTIDKMLEAIESAICNNDGNVNRDIAKDAAIAMLENWPSHDLGKNVVGDNYYMAKTKDEVLVLLKEMK